MSRYTGKPVYRFAWQKSSDLPEPFTWFNGGTSLRPTIWAGIVKRHSKGYIWRAVFADFAGGWDVTADTRCDAADMLLERSGVLRKADQ